MKFSLSTSKVTITILLSLFFLGCNKKEESKLTVNTKEVTEITTNSAKCGGSVTVIGNYTIGACGVCWSETPSPTINDFFTTDNQGSGEFTSLMKNLKPGTKYYVRAYAKTSSDPMYGEELDFTTEALPVATVTIYTSDVSEITASSAKCGGVVTANGDVTITDRGVCWSTSQNPTVNDSHTSDGQGLGAFTSILSELTASTPYYIRAYATTGDGNTSYGDSKTFTTSSGGGGGSEVTVTVYTNEVTEITDSSAKCGGIVTANGDATITARGIYWSTSQDFTLNVSHTSDGQGLGSFTSNLAGLTANTLYYVKAYATTSDGNTVYSNEIKSFSTLDVPGPAVELPTVEIGNVSDITGTSAKCSGNVTSDGGDTVTERGFCWSTSSTPMIYHSHIACGSGTGSFNGDLTGLSSGTTYYVRAYATNSEGTNYSTEERTFTTPTLPTVITNEVTDITQTTATGGGNVTNDGGAAITSRGLCWSTSPNPTLETASSAIIGSGSGSFTGQITGLTVNTDYYVKAFATNVVGTNYGDQKTFRTQESSISDAWLYYGDAIFKDAWGLTDGGDDEWAIMFPATSLSQYAGTSITKVQVYFYETGRYTLKIYRGGTSSPTTLLESADYNITNTGWRGLLVEPAITLNTSQSLWVSISYSYEAGHYPKCSGEGIGEPNARWGHSNGSAWYDVYDHNEGVDLCWLIRVYVSNESKGVFDQELVMPTSPKQSNRNTPQKTSTEAIPTNMRISTKMKR